jgi:hypothetical protein
MCKGKKIVLELIVIQFLFVFGAMFHVPHLYRKTIILLIIN